MDESERPWILSDFSLPFAASVAVIAVTAGILWWWFNEEPEVFLSSSDPKQLTLIDRMEVSHDTRRFVFALSHKNELLGLPIGNHIVLYGPNREGKEPGLWNCRSDYETSSNEISRKYTPVSSVSTRGQLELVVKIYRPNEQFVDGGKMSQHLEGMEIGDQVTVTGPVGLLCYKGCGNFEFKKRKMQVKNVGMIAGGTGITPMYQIIKSVLENHADNTKMFLLFANKTEKDILLRDELEEFANQYPDRLSLEYIVETPPPEWTHSSGRASADILRKFLPSAASDTVCLCCGPPPMVESCNSLLLQIGHKSDNIFPM